MSKIPNKERHAIVIIHGIGNQSPMGTVRGFVESILADREVDESEMTKHYWSTPDLISNSFSLRRLVVKAYKGQPTTDCFEYYWAHKMHGNKATHFMSWLSRLLTTLPFDAGKRIERIWISIWLLILTIIFFFATPGYTSLYPSDYGLGHTEVGSY